MTRRVSIFVNGILTPPGDSKNWNCRAVTWTHLNTDSRGEALQYWVGPISRAFGEAGRGRKLAALLSSYLGWDITLVGHSNGTDVILEALADLDWPCVNSLHLVSGACEADFVRNGLNAALLDDKIGKVFVYVAGKDLALRLAKLGRFLGYGILGLHGPINVAQSEKVGTLECPDYGHSTWWEPQNFERTMRHFV